MTAASPPGSSHASHDFDVEESDTAKKIDFSRVDSGRRGKRDKGGEFSAIAEADEEDEESTVNGEEEDDENMFDETENFEPGTASSSLIPTLKKFSL